MRWLAFAIAISALGQTGCSTMNNTEKGVGLGGLVGAGVGTAIGAATGNPKTGAVVGTLAGAGIGGIIGNDVDRADNKEKDRQGVVAAHAYAEAQPNRVDEVVQMAKNGQSDRVIINHIRQNRMRFVLNANDLNYLKASSVPDGVIVEMQNAGEPAPRPVVVVREPVYVRPAPPPVIIMDPYGPPGFGMHYHHRRW